MSLKSINDEYLITLRKDDFPENADNVTLELEGEVLFKGVKRDYYEPKHYLISELPREFQIITNNEITEIKYFYNQEEYIIHLK